jgi:hypothetical protein
LPLARSFADAALTSAATLPTDALIASRRDIGIVAHPLRDGFCIENTSNGELSLIGIAFDARLSCSLLIVGEDEIMLKLPCRVRHASRRPSTTDGVQ